MKTLIFANLALLSTGNVICFLRIVFIASKNFLHI
jgi:hypothetical protein